MLAYLRYLYRNMLKKIGVYLSVMIVYILFALTTYLLPKLINVDYSLLSMRPFVFTINCMSIAIFTTILTVYIFKDGIDDGTELLIASKPISRVQNIWSKLICLLSLIFIFSVPMLFIQAFLAIDHDVVAPLIFGPFLLMLLVGYIFAGISIISSLVFKKVGTTLVSIAVSIILMFISIVNMLIVVPMSNKIVNTYGYRINQVYIPTKNNQSTRAYLLFKNDLPYTNGNADKINEIVNNAYISSKNNIAYIYDFMYQWTTLINLNNYPCISQNSNPLINMTNLICNTIPTFYNVPLDELLRIQIPSNTVNNYYLLEQKEIPYYINKQGYYSLPMDTLKFKCIWIPIINITPTGIIDKTNPITLNLYDLNANKPENNNIIYDKIFGNNSSIYNAYQQFITKYKSPISTLLNYDNDNFLNFYSTYLLTAIQILSQQYLSNNQSTIIVNYYGKNNVTIPNAPAEIIKTNPLLFGLVDEMKNFQNQPSATDTSIYYNVKFQAFLNNFYLINLYNIQQQIFSNYKSIITTRALSNEKIFLNFYNTSLAKIHANFIPVNSVKAANQLSVINTNSNITDLNSLMKVLNNWQTDQDAYIKLKTFIESSNIKYISSPIELLSEHQMSTLSYATVHPVINFWGMIIAWLFIGSILWYVGALIYIKKDFR